MHPRHQHPGARLKASMHGRILLVAIALAGNCLFAQPLSPSAAVPSVPQSSATGTSATPATPVSPAASVMTAASGPRFTIGDGYVRLSPGTNGGQVDVLVSAEQLGKEAMVAPGLTVRDLGKDSHGTTTATYGNPVERQTGGGTSRTWFVTVSVSDLPINTDQVRHAFVKLGDLERAVPYVLSNRYRGTPDFSVSLRPLWVLWKGSDDATAVVIATSEQPVSGLRIAQSTLTEKTTSAPINLQALELCENPSGACKPPMKIIPPATPITVYLRIKETERQNGRFSGTVAFAVDARAEPKPATLEVVSSDVVARLIGAILIAIGVVGAWQISVWSRARFGRLAALKPVVAGRSRLEDLLRRLEIARGTTKIHLAALQDRLSREVEELTEVALDREGLLPSRTAPFWSTPDAPDLQKRLTRLEEVIAGFTLAVCNGVEPLARRWSLGPVAERESVENGLRKLNSPDDASTEPGARTLVAAAFGLATPPHVPGAQSQPSAAAPPQAPLTPEQITSEIESLSRVAWTAYLVLVSIAGVSMLVLNNPGFGTGLDYVYCFFWGFGLPIVYDKLQQLTPAGVSSALSVTLPK